MNERPTINWKWNAEHGILNIISSGDGYYVLLEVDDEIYETGEGKALCSIMSAVGNSHQARACNSKNGSIVSEWVESSFLVPEAGSSSSESSPSDASDEGGGEDHGDYDDAEQSSKSTKYLEVKSLLERAIVALILQKPASEFFEDEGKNFSSMDEKNMCSLDNEA